jgi:hypothetical protein
MMAERRRRAEFGDEEAEGDQLWRLLVWTGCTFVAVAIAVLAAKSDRGSERLSQAWAGIAGFATGLFPPAAGPTVEAGNDMRRLTEAIKSVTADRDRLLARLDRLERGVGATGSLPREALPAVGNVPPAVQPRSIPATPPAGAPPSVAAASAAPSAGTNSVQTGEALAAAVSPTAMSSVASTTQFGVDLGGGQTVEMLRALWGALRDAYPKHLSALRPVVAVHEGGKPGAPDLRLVAGPLNNASDAARLCGALTAVGLLCQPTLFDGQRLAVR